MNSDLVIDISHVEKLYSGAFGRKGVHALRDISMQVHAGSVFGLLGPNGAGKSTLVKILMTVIRATRCEGTFLGGRVGDKSNLRKVGYLPEHHRFPDYLTARQVLDYFGALGEVPRAERKTRGTELLELVGLKDWSNHKVRGFSKGMRQRLGIANALIGDPELVVLDEPTDGVDPVGRRDIREVLLKLRDRGKTVFLNSHLLSELEMVCDRVAILVQGKVSAQGTIEELTRDSRRYEIEIAPPPGAPELGVQAATFLPGLLSAHARFEQPAASDSDALPTSGPRQNAKAIAVRGTLHSGVPVLVDGFNLSVGTDDAAMIQPLLDVLRSKGIVLKAVRPVRASLEDLFMQAVTDPTTGRALAPGAKRGEAKL